MKNKIQQRGFTLIELLVVIVILGILSTISVGTFRSYFAKARDSERVSTVQNLAMMIKVDSGGSGDCTVYNYAMLAETADPCDTEDISTGLEDLLADNDYSMPDEKNGLAFFYGIHMGATSGNNNFFIVVGAEEDVPQNGKPIGATTDYVFVDGTTKGIAAVQRNDNTTAGTVDILAGCVWTADEPVCNADWEVYEVIAEGELTQ